jgi:hypothetical protein
MKRINQKQSLGILEDQMFCGTIQFDVFKLPNVLSIFNEVSLSPGCIKL